MAGLGVCARLGEAHFHPLQVFQLFKAEHSVLFNSHLTTSSQHSCYSTYKSLPSHSCMKCKSTFFCKLRFLFSPFPGKGLNNLYKKQFFLTWKKISLIFRIKCMDLSNSKTVINHFYHLTQLAGKKKPNKQTKKQSSCYE